MTLLNRQVAIVNFAPLKPQFVGIWAGAYASLPGLPLAPALRSPMQRNAREKPPPDGGSLPAVCLKISGLIERLKAAYNLFFGGKFAEAKDEFDAILRAIPLTVAETRQESNEMKELLEICREYVTAIRLKNAMGDAGDDAVRATELAAYFTHCNLQPAHLMLALNLAMTASFKAKCFITAAGFARRLLELPDIASEKNAQVRSKAQKVLQKSEAQARNEHELAYDERNPFVVDCSALTPIYRGAPVVRCAFCGSAYEPSFKGKVCVTCGLALVGVETLGLVTMGQASRR